LSNSIHANNATFYFDAIEGRLKPIPYNVSLWEEDAGVFPGTPTDLQKRIWEIPEFKTTRADVFYSYVEENKEDDLLFLENWSEAINREFYRDNAKPDNNITYWSKIKTFKELVAQYFDDPHDKVNDTESYPLSDREERELKFSDSFVYLPETIVSASDFVKTHPGFILRGSEIVLSAGSYFFSKDIIIPVNTKLVISPGATLFMGEGVSLVSYSPVDARGTFGEPIKILAANGSKPWGVLAVINTEDETSHFNYLQVSGGKDDRINGVYFSGMLALHNASGDIKNSRFENANADDAVNIKKGEVIIENNTFRDNSSDGLDIDFALGETVLINNMFFDNGGDAIDLSWSDVLIEGNIIADCGDKGISVGERSMPTISENIIAGCAVGIASKDSSHTIARGNIFVGNSTAISVYQKKPIYGGGSIEVEGGVLWNNARDTRADDFSNIELEGVNTSVPDLSHLPSFIQEKILK